MLRKTYSIGSRRMMFQYRQKSTCRAPKKRRNRLHMSKVMLKRPTLRNMLIQYRAFDFRAYFAKHSLEHEKRPRMLTLCLATRCGYTGTPRHKFELLEDEFRSEIDNEPIIFAEGRAAWIKRFEG